jgi:hypothetical protein
LEETTRQRSGSASLRTGPRVVSPPYRRNRAMPRAVRADEDIGDPGLSSSSELRGRGLGLASLPAHRLKRQEGGAHGRLMPRLDEDSAGRQGADGLVHHGA